MLTFVFVLMPFDRLFDDIYLFGIKGAAEDEGAFAERIDDQVFTEGVLDRIFNQISKADVVVADMSGRNANVFYEVGYAHALGKVVLLLTKEAEDIPFDLRNRQHIVYQNNIGKLRTELGKALRWAVEESRRHKLGASSEKFEVRFFDCLMQEDGGAGGGAGVSATIKGNPNIQASLVVRNVGLLPFRGVSHAYLFTSDEAPLVPIRSKSLVNDSGQQEDTLVLRAAEADARDGLGMQYLLDGEVGQLPPGASDVLPVRLRLRQGSRADVHDYRLRLHTSQRYYDYSFRLKIVDAASRPRESSESATSALNLEVELAKDVFGQGPAIEEVSRTLRAGLSGLKSGRRPLGAFLFAGPAGVGKENLARSLALLLFQDTSYLRTFDMGEYMEKFSISRLVGVPPGYARYDEGGELTEFFRKNGKGVLLLKRIESAHPDFIRIMTNSCLDGTIIDGSGREISFASVVVIMTTEVGLPRKGRALGFEPPPASTEGASAEQLSEEMSKVFGSEFLAALDKMVVFDDLTHSARVRIVNREIEKTNQRLSSRGHSIELTEKASEYLARDAESGNAPGLLELTRRIRSMMEGDLAEELLRQAETDSLLVRVDVDDSGLFSIESWPHSR